MKAKILESIGQTRDVMQSVIDSPDLIEAIGNAATLCIARLRAGSKLLFCGNGGSAADSQHLAGELISRFMYDRPGLPAVALTTDTSVLTAIGNDYGYERIFSRQVEALGNAGDVLVAISTSGRSRNVLAAIDAARSKQLHVIGMTGASGGAMIGTTSVLICAPSQLTPRIQEVHIAVGHVICALIEEALFPNGQ